MDSSRVVDENIGSAHGGCHGVKEKFSAIGSSQIGAEALGLAA
jgi:hypothetical protein